MKSKKVKWIWVFSISTTLAIIGLQGYWLYNQYVYNIQKNADVLENEIKSVWDDYKALQKNRLNANKHNFLTYNLNTNQNKIYASDSTKDRTVTTWDIKIKTKTKESVKDSTKRISQKVEIFNGKYQYDFQDSVSQKMGRNEESTSKESIDALDSIVKRPWKMSKKTDGNIIIKHINFSTKENQNVIEEAMELYLSYISNPFRKSELDSLIITQTSNINFKTDTFTLSNDSVLWNPKTVREINISNPMLRLSIPYNLLEKKVYTITGAIPPNAILQQMFWQIIITSLLLILLIIVLAIQIKNLSHLMKVNRLRQDFVNTTIHELKRPVQTLKSMISYLKTDSEKENETLQIIEDVRNETNNLTSYLKKLREVNEGESISDSIHLSYFNFNDVVQKNIAELKKNSHKTIHIETRLPNEDVMITADKIAMNNVITNLLENSVKYSCETVDIVIKAEKQNNKFKFSVTDDGFGIDIAEQSHILEPFYRSTNERITTLPGMGLGLSYVKMIVDAHKGTLNIQSKPNQGTTITIEIPQL